MKEKKIAIESKLTKADNPKEYITVKNDDHLAEIIGYKNKKNA